MVVVLTMMCLMQTGVGIVVIVSALLMAVVAMGVGVAVRMGVRAGIPTLVLVGPVVVVADKILVVYYPAPNPTIVAAIAFVTFETIALVMVVGEKVEMAMVDVLVHVMLHMMLHVIVELAGVLATIIVPAAALRVVWARIAGLGGGQQWCSDS